MTRRAKVLVLYVGVAYGFTWCIWWPYVVAARRAEPLPNAYAYYLASFGPLLAAFVAEAYDCGAVGVRDLARRIVDWRRPGRWALVGLLSPLLLVPIAAGLVAVQSGVWPDWTRFGVSSQAPGLGPITTWLLMTATFGVGEEAGWRGFLQPRLQSSHTAFAATMMLTAVWAAWHTPAFFFREGYVDLGVAGTVAFLLGLTAGAVVLASLYNASSGSVLAAALWHGTWNWVATSDALQMPWVAVMSALVIVAALVIAWRYGLRDLAATARQAIAPTPNRATGGTD